MKKYVFEIKSDVIDTDMDFGFYSKPVVFDPELHRYGDAYGLRAITNLRRSNTKPFVEKLPEFLGFVDLDPQAPNQYYELPEFKVEIPIDDDIDEELAFNLAREIAQFICWQMIKAIYGRYYNIDSYLEFFGGLIYNEFKAWDNKLHNIEAEYKFTGNADGKIILALKLVEEGKCERQL